MPTSPPAVELNPWANVQETETSAVIDGRGGGSTVRFCLCVEDGRLQVGLVLPHHDRPVDLSREPAVLAAALSPPAEAHAALGPVGGWLAGFASRHGLWASRAADLHRGLTGAAYPLLQEPYDRGSAALTEVPRWAAPALGERSARAAATVVLGSRATRPTVSALAQSLARERPGSPPDLLPLGLVLMAGPVLTADAVARVLRTGATRPQVGDGLPSVADVTRFRRQATWLGPDRVTRLLVDALTLPDGLRLLLQTSLLLDGLPAAHRHRLPTRLRPLHARCHELTPLDPRPALDPDHPGARIAPLRPPAPIVGPARARRAPRSPVAVARATGAPGPAVVAAGEPAAPDPGYGTRGLVAPASRATTVPPGTVLPHRPAVARLHGQPIASHLRLVVPRTVAELQTWGRRLHNCLGTYGAAAVEGRSVLVGVERHDVLAYCAEITPGTGRIRQLLASHNRRVPRADADLVVAALRRAGVIAD